MNRLSNLRKLFSKEGFDSVLISSVPNITYLTNFSNFSKDEREAFLFVTESHSYILTDGRYSEAVKKEVKDFELIEISPSQLLKDVLSKLADKHKILKVGIEENNLTVSEYKKFKTIFKSTSNLDVSKIRIQKDGDEVKKIQKACKIGDLAYSHILEKLRIGVTENEIAFEIESFIKSGGATLSFDPIVAFGKNSSVPHHQTGKTKLKKNQIVLLDFGVKYENYCSDMTRTVFFGKPDLKIEKMYQAVLDAQQKSIEQLNSLAMKQSDIKASDIDRVAREYIISKGYPSIPHSLGHGIGLEVHEAPHLSGKSKDVLKTGMVFSVEPGIYIPGFGGIRIEDLVVLTEKGPKLLTHSPREIIEV